MSQVTALRSTSSLVISPPTVLVPDEPSTVESALLRLSPTSSWLPLKNKRLSWLRIRSASYKKSKHRLPIPVKEEGFESPWLQPVIEINGDPPTTTNGAGDNENTYIWAYLDENQRGLTMFSKPYFSGSMLLPIDPLPFTVPSSKTPTFRAHHPDVSLTHYPLPSGDWQWVSKAWMIDMRSSDTVQHDGFEYNSRFRASNWTPKPGLTSFVRRRRWMRLAKRGSADSLYPGDPRNVVAFTAANKALISEPSQSSTMPNVQSRTDIEMLDLAEAEQVYRGEDIQQDWQRCHSTLRRLNRDGRKLELWSAWLCVPTSTSHVPRKQWTEDDEESIQTRSVSRVLINTTVKDSIASVLRLHGREIMELFVYPESKAQLCNMLGRAKLFSELDQTMNLVSSASSMEFWSYASELEKECEQYAADAQLADDAIKDEIFVKAIKENRDKAISDC